MSAKLLLLFCIILIAGAICEVTRAPSAAPIIKGAVAFDAPKRRNSCGSGRIRIFGRCRRIFSSRSKNEEEVNFSQRKVRI
ncbi:Hypothetical predicted protein [Cloeon dipterum]|uniref:Uncharacterized protein n=1 Tax=Cloeon dipterum TaxID=197152 RepID=A0A8S1CEU2_9INSE|nr:Hypothetical predicted protein [Cloeon dipterum]